MGQLRRVTGLIRQPMKRRQPRRDWRDAFHKGVAEGYRCRVCGSEWGVELAHILGRMRDERRGAMLYVHPDSIVPLCHNCHCSYDGHTLDLWPFLHKPERAWAVARVGEGQARRRISGRNS